MGLNSTWYVDSVKYAAVTAWAASTAKTVGQLIRPLAAQSEGNERVFVCTTAGTTASSESTYLTTKGALKSSGTANFYECSGQAAVNGDNVNTPAWAASRTPVAGDIIKNIANTHYFICTTAGAGGVGSEPSWNTTSGATTTDASATWTCIGPKGNFTAAFAAPHGRIANALQSDWGGLGGNPAGTGPTFYIGSAHAESATVSFTPAVGGNVANPAKFLSVTNTAAPPVTLTAGAAFTNSNAISFINGAHYTYGLVFTANHANVNSAVWRGTPGIFENCTFNQGVNDASYFLSFQASLGKAKLINCNYVLANAGQSIRFNSVGGLTEMIGGNFFQSGSAPSGTGFTIAAAGRVIIRDADLSKITDRLFESSVMTDPELHNCRLDDTVDVSDYVSATNATYRLHNCFDTGSAIAYKMAQAYGIVTTDDTVYNDAGASNGDDNFSLKAVTVANTSFINLLEMEPIYFYNDVVGSAQTAIVEIAGGATLTNGDIWMEIEYLGNASYPLASNATNRKTSILSSASNHGSSGASWTGSGVGTKQTLETTFTAQLKGLIKARIFIAKPSATIYVDPKLTLEA